ncbi:MAG: PQQ-dependent sugar dehydrogenase [Blastocatellia bacterium]
MTCPVHVVMPRLILAWLVLVFLSMATFAQTFTDAGFAAETVAQATRFDTVGFAFAPDGRIFTWEKPGVVRIIKNGVQMTTPFLDLRSRVYSQVDSGLIGLALDPNFAANRFIYLLYTFDDGTNPTATGPRTARLTRVQADPNNPDVALANSEVVLMGKIGSAPCSAQPVGADCMASDSGAHTIGTVRFGLDGKIYVGMGDGSSFTAATEQSFRSQDLNYYNGKILRINPDGTAPSDNPFYDGNPNSVRSKVYSYGLRSPYRFTHKPGTGELYIGDVGAAKFEEINRGRGANFGWPCYEGPNPQSSFQAAFPQRCGQIPASAVTPPLYSYDWNGGSAIVMGPFYTGTQYPTQYRNNLFFADFVQGFIRRAVFDASNNLSSVQSFATGVDSPVYLEQGLDGFLYYLSVATGELKRVRFSGTAPIALATATRPSAAQPYTVAFSSAGSTGGTLSYLWEFGDNTTSTAANPTHTYTATGIKTFTAKLTVTNTQGLSGADTVDVIVGDRPPVATITTPANNTHVKVGTTVTFTGTGTDPDETLPSSALKWTVLLHHNEHIHPGVTATGTSGSFLVEDHGTTGDTFFYEIVLTVTDSAGVADTKRVNIIPDSPVPPPPPPPPAPLPVPWVSKDVGTVGKAGSASVTNGVFTIKGSGDTIGDSVDSFQYVYQTLSGDGEIKARVTSVQNTAANAKAGVMIRESLAANARYLMVRYRQDNHTALIYRSSTGGNTNISDADAQQFQRWVRLVRRGNQFSSYQSADGVNWKLITTLTLNLPTDLLFGLAVTAANNATLCTATVDNVAVTKAVTPPPPITGTGTGLKGEYFNKENFTDLRFTRTDAGINFDWGKERPIALLGKDHFSVRWTGVVQPRFTGSYTFYLTASDTVRLWVNGQLLVNASNANVAEYRGTISLIAGQKYAIKVEFAEKDKAASIRLDWASAQEPRQLIPRSQLYVQ